MIPCKFCKECPSSRGLKQIGKTRTAGTLFARRYRCQDCGAASILSGDVRAFETIRELWFPPGSPEAAILCQSRIRFSLLPPLLGRMARMSGPQQVN